MIRVQHAFWFLVGLMTLIIQIPKMLLEIWLLRRELRRKGYGKDLPNLFIHTFCFIVPEQMWRSISMKG